MKKFTITFLINTFLTAIAYAGHHSNLQLSSPGFSGIIVDLDGFVVNYDPERVVFIDDLEPGMHCLRVTTLVRRSRYHFEMMERTLFDGEVFIDEGSDIRAMIDHFGRFRIMSTAPIQPVMNDPGCGQGTMYFDPYKRRMSDHDFNQMLMTIRQASFESTRISIAKTAITQSFLTTEQVRQVLGLFWFESSKLEFARFAVDRVVDRQLFYTLGREFKFSSSVEELMRMI